MGVFFSAVSDNSFDYASLGPAAAICSKFETKRGAHRNIKVKSDPAESDNNL